MCHLEAFVCMLHAYVNFLLKIISILCLCEQEKISNPTRSRFLNTFFMHNLWRMSSETFTFGAHFQEVLIRYNIHHEGCKVCCNTEDSALANVSIYFTGQRAQDESSFITGVTELVLSGLEKAKGEHPIL